MLTISPKVHRAFQDGAEQEYLLRLGAFLREAVPSLADEPPSTLLPQLRQIISQSRGYGLESEQAIASYAVTAGLLGLDFDSRFPGAGQILHSGESEGRKAELLEGFAVRLFEALER